MISIDADDDPFDLGFPPPQRLKKAEEPRFHIIGPLTEREADAILDNPAPSGVMKSVTLKEIKYYHHRLAQLVAKGERITDIALITGYTPNYISQLVNNDPSFKQLVADYQQVTVDKFADAADRLKTLGITSIDELQTRIQEDPDSFSKRELIEIVEMAILKPLQQKTTTAVVAGGPGAVNVQVNFVKADHQEMKLIPAEGRGGLEIPAIAAESE